MSAVGSPGPRPKDGRQRVLVGVDGSEDALRALRYAVREAEASDADVWIVHAVDVASQATGLWDVVADPESLSRAGEAVIAAARQVVAEAGLADERVSADVVMGSPGEVLYRASRQAHLLVLGRRSLSGLERMFVGSTSVAAALRAECPVIVISAAATPQQTGDKRTVAVAVNTWPVHAPALEWGLREGRMRNARLRVVHVVPETLGVEGPQFVTAAGAGLDEQLAPFRAQHPGVVLDSEVLLGDPVGALVDLSGSVDLLILGHHRPGGALGGVVRAVLAHAHCPVGVITEPPSRTATPSP